MTVAARSTFSQPVEIETPLPPNDTLGLIAGWCRWRELGQQRRVDDRRGGSEVEAASTSAPGPLGPRWSAVVCIVLISSTYHLIHFSYACIASDRGPVRTTPVSELF